MVGFALKGGGVFFVHNRWRSEVLRHILLYGSSQLSDARGNMPYIQISDDVRSLAGAGA
jgi:hypothetical protein